ncbi:MAG: hypothetical protein M3133_02085 [Actinomycetota bacterium]|nr:hypothetical protein [Actinomycetota bacterium]
MPEPTSRGIRGADAPDPPVGLALVHHANQYLVTSGYDDREGIDELVAGYAAVLRLHEERRVPANLHFSGTLLEAAAWHAPWFLELIRRLHHSGLVEVIGGTHADGIMTVLPQTLHRRGILEHLDLCTRHLGCDPRSVTAFWVPERVWETSSIAPLLTSPELANGGFDCVLLDDRLFYPSSSPRGTPPSGRREHISPRRRFDAAGPYHRGACLLPPQPADMPAPAFVADAEGLLAVPISSWLRYCVPPRRSEHWELLQWILARASEQAAPPLLVYADDLERTAGLASWERQALPAYAEFLDWVIAQERLVPVRLTSWLHAHPPHHVATVEPGTFFELAERGAGEDYRGWWDATAWAPYRRHLAEAEEAIRSAERDGIGGALVELAWKHLLASTYETAWHNERELSHRPAPAPWARATASHVRSCQPMLAAARSFASPRQPHADVVDLDADGEEEAVLSNGLLYAVWSPSRGGRLTALFTHNPTGDAAVIGNPSDDWNWQEELHAYMERPPNHPGALSDVGFEHDRYEVAAASTSPSGAGLELVNVDATSPLAGTRKRILLPAGRAELFVCYRWPQGVSGLAIDLCLSPDYLRLLREGRACLATEEAHRSRGARVGDVAVSVRLASDEATQWVEPTRNQVGHGIVSRVRCDTSHFHLVIDCSVGAKAATQPYCPDEAADLCGALPACTGG